MSSASLYAALSGELSDISARLTRLQSIPLLGPEPLQGQALMDAMVAVQDLDRLAQDASAVSGLLADLAECGDDIGEVRDALRAMPLRSLAERLEARLA